MGGMQATSTPGGECLFWGAGREWSNRLEQRSACTDDWSLLRARLSNGAGVASRQTFLEGQEYTGEGEQQREGEPSMR